LQGVFTASHIFGSSLQATVDFTGNNFVQYQDGTPNFVGTLSMTGFASRTSSTKAGFGINEIDLSVNTIAQTLSGGILFTFPFGAQAPEGDVTIVGSWANGPTVNEVDVSFFLKSCNSHSRNTRFDMAERRDRRQKYGCRLAADNFQRKPRLFLRPENRRGLHRHLDLVRTGKTLMVFCSTRIPVL
jgi:hypothetical protein